GDLLVNISNFNYGEQSLSLDKIVLKNVTSKLIRYPGDSTYNYQYLIDYFDPEKKDTTKKQEWNVKFGDLVLENVSFVYRTGKSQEPVTQNMDFDNIWLQHTYGTISGFKQDKDTIVAMVI